MKKAIVAIMAVAGIMTTAAHAVTYPFPDVAELITEEPVGESGWYSRTSTKYVHLMGPLEYGGESSVPSKIVVDDNGKVYIGGVFSDFEGGGWLAGSIDDSSGEIRMDFPQIMYDESYTDGKNYYYYACCMRLNDDMSDFEITDDQTVSFHRDNDGSIIPDDSSLAIGVCYVVDPSSGEQPSGSGYAGCELQWFGIAYSDIKWNIVNATVATIPDNVDRNRYALIHKNGALFVDVAVADDKLYIHGILDDSDACIIGNIANDGHTVIFPSNQFMGVMESGESFCYMVAFAPEDAEDPESGEILHLTAPAKQFPALWNPEKGTLSFVEPETGFAISTAESKVGGGSLYVQPRLSPQDDYIVDAPDAPEILAYNPYDENQGYGTINFNLPDWNSDGLLINPENIYYNLYLDNNIMTLSNEQYFEINNDLTDIPYRFTDNYDVFSVGINHAVYLYSGGYKRIGIQSFTLVNGVKYCSPIVYDSSAAINNIITETGHVRDMFYLNMSGVRIENPESGFFIKCTCYEDGTVKAEKVIVRNCDF